MEQEEKQRKKVHFRDLDGGLKAIVIISWIMAGFMALSFLVGFMSGLIA